MGLIKINAEKTIRNINLYLLSDMDIELEEPYLTIYNMLNSQFRDMNVYKHDNEIYYGTSKSSLYFRYFILDGYPILLNYNNSFNFLDNIINGKYIILDDDIIKILEYYFYLKFNITDRNVLCPKSQGALYIKSLKNCTIVR